MTSRPSILSCGPQRGPKRLSKTFDAREAAVYPLSNVTPARGAVSTMSMPQQEEFAEPFKRIDVNQAKQLIEKGGVSVIDVREDWEFVSGHIPNARHVPLARIISAAQQHVEGDNLIFVCELGQRS